MNKGGPSLTFVPDGAPVSKVNVAGMDEPAAASEGSPSWLTCPADGPPPMTVRALSEEPKPSPAAGRLTKEQRVIQALADLVKKMSNTERKRALKAKRKRRRSKSKPSKRSGASLVVKALSPPLHLKTCRHRVPLGNLGLRVMKPEWALFRKLATPGADSTGQGDTAPKKKPLRGNNPSLEVRALSAYADPDASGARTLVVNDSCSSRNNCVFRAPGRYKPLIVNSNPKEKKKKLGAKASKSRKLKRKAKTKTFEILLRNPFCTNELTQSSCRVRPYTSK